MNDGGYKAFDRAAVGTFSADDLTKGVNLATTLGEKVNQLSREQEDLYFMRWRARAQAAATRDWQWEFVFVP